MLPVRDGAAFLAQAVRSILAQTLDAIEVLVVDDGSRDGSAAILAGLAAADPRLRVLRQDRLGLVAALNRGLAEARAPYLARMDADDIAWPERLARQAAVLDSAADIALVGSACRVIGPDGVVRRTEHPPVAAAAVHAELDRRNCIIHPSVMLRRAAVLACGGYRAACLGAEDFDLWLRLRERHLLINLEAVLLDYRDHAGQSAWRAIEQRMLSEMGALAAAARRAEGEPDGLDDAGPIDRGRLRTLGMSEAAISEGFIARALGTAKDALKAGRCETVRAAVDLALRQPTLRPRTRLHLWLLRLRASQ